MADEEHSLLSASGAPRWTRCFGSLAMESQYPNRGSSFAREGTAAHALGAVLLGANPKEIPAQDIEAWGRGCAMDWMGYTIVVEGDTYTVDLEMAGHVQTYVDLVKEYAGPTGVIMAENRVNYASFLGVAEHLAWGTSDAIVIRDREMIVIDLKYGAGVLVNAAGNEQAKLYALGAYNEVEAYADIDHVRWVICQPRIARGLSEDDCTLQELKQWGRVEAAMAAQHALKLHAAVAAAETPEDRHRVVQQIAPELTPGDKQCRFCNAKADCPALSRRVFEDVANEFVDLDALDKGSLTKHLSARADVKSLTHVELADKMRAADLIESWVKAVRGRVEELLNAGEPVPGYKLVQGKKGARRWVDAEAAAKTLKRVLGTKDAMTEPQPISPTKAEAFAKAGRITARQWKALQDITTQSEGGLSVAPESDKRPAVVVENAFSNLEGDDGDLSDLA